MAFGRNAFWPALACLLTACSNAPSEPEESDLAAAYQRVSKGAQLRKIACQKASEAPGYVCDARVRSCSRPEAACAQEWTSLSGRFVKGPGGWMLMSPQAAPPAPAAPPQGEAASGTVVAAAAETRELPTPAWLEGAWVGKDDHCAGDTGLVFRRDGAYGSGEMTGSWALEGGRLTIRFRETPLPGEDEGPAETARLTIVRESRDRMLMDGDPLRRCPPGGGTEPWFPSETFTTG